MATLTVLDRALLRLYINDPPEPDNVISDSQLDQLYVAAEESLEGTAARAWRIKAATVADWYLSNIDGAFLSRDQVFDHCVKMAVYYEEVSGTSFIIANVGLKGPNSVDVAATSEF